MRGILTTLGIPKSPQSLDIKKNSDEGISDFIISGQSLLGDITLRDHSPKWFQKLIILRKDLRENPERHPYPKHSLNGLSYLIALT